MEPGEPAARAKGEPARALRLALGSRRGLARFPPNPCVLTSALPEPKVARHSLRPCCTVLPAGAGWERHIVSGQALALAPGVVPYPGYQLVKPLGAGGWSEV